MKKELYFKEVKDIVSRIEEVKKSGKWDWNFHNSYYVGMLTGITYMFIKEFFNDDEAWNEFKKLRDEAEEKVYENKSI